MVKVKKECILIKPEDIKPSSPEFEILGTFNPGVARLANGDIIVYVRVWEKLKKTEDENFCYSPRMCGTDKYKIIIDKFDKELIENTSDLDFLFKDGTKRFTFISHLRRVILDKTGMKIKNIDDKPSFFGLDWDGELGVEDPRITKIDDLYVMTYVSLSRAENISTSYAISNDCIDWYRRGVIFSEQNKDVVLFPELINKEYVAIERPEGNLGFTLPHMWIVYSKDMELWGRQHPLIIFKKGDWDVGKVGAGPPPIKTEKGWLLIYHGVLNFKKRKVIENIMHKMEISECISGTITSKDVIYCAGAALFDINDPRKLIAKTDVPIFFPMKKHEIADFGNLRVIFPTGLLMDENKKDLLIYSGAGDRVTSVKKVSLNKILRKLKPIKS
jgi:predicted GH43/DUF377 family glycosyl hydrolase